MRRRSDLSSIPKLRCFCFGSLAAVIARDVRDHDLLRRRHAEQVGVQDQVIRVLVVPLVADVIADVVQQRGVGRAPARSSLSRPSRSPIASNSTSASSLHVRRMRLLDVAALRELASPSARALRRDRRSSARRAPLRAAGLRECRSATRRCRAPRAAHDFGGDGDSGDDDVGALRIETRHLTPLLGRHLGEHVENVLEVGARNVRGVDRARGENALSREVDAGEVRERAAGADELRRRASRGAAARSRSPSRLRLRSLRTPLGVTPSPRNSSVRRIAPNGSEPSRSITPSAASASSSEPPPMSIDDRCVRRPCRSARRRCGS